MRYFRFSFPLKFLLCISMAVVFSGFILVLGALSIVSLGMFDGLTAITDFCENVWEPLLKRIWR